MSAGSGRTDRTGGVQVAAVQQDVRDVEVGLLRSGVAARVQGWDAQRSDSRTGTCFGYRDKITSVLSALPVNVVRDLVDVTLKLAAWDYDQSVWSISDERHGGADVVGDVEEEVVCRRTNGGAIECRCEYCACVSRAASGGWWSV